MHSCVWANTSLTPWNIVTTFAGSGTAGLVDGTGAAAQLANPWGLAYDGGGYIYITQGQGFMNGFINSAVRRLDLNTRYVATVAGTGTPGHTNGPGGSAQFNMPQGITVMNDGRLLVADTNNDRIRLVDPGNGFQTSDYAGTGSSGYTDGAAAGATFTWPMGMATGPDGTIYVADMARIRSINPSTNQVTTFAGTVSTTMSDATDGPQNGPRFQYNMSVALNAAGDKVYVGDRGHCYFRIVTGGNVTSLVGANVPIQIPLSQPAGIVIDPYGTAYFTDANVNFLIKVQNDSTGDIIAGGLDADRSARVPNSGLVNGSGATALFDGPSGMVQDADGSLYIADSYNHVIRKIDANKININPSNPAAVGYTNSVISLERNTVYTRMDGEAGSQIELNGHNLTFGKNDGTTDDSTFNGVLTGNGDLIINAGAGKTLALTGVNTYQGTTTVTTGTLTGNTTSIRGNLTNNGTVNFNQTVKGTFSYNISGNGVLSKLGSAELTLSGNNTAFNGTTVIGNGSLSVEVRSLPGTNVMVNNLASLKVTATSNFTTFKTFSGVGDISKDGPGTLTLTGNHTHTGNLYINQGRLNVNGIYAGIINVSTGGIVGGLGTTNQQVVVRNGGIIHAGNSIGTFNVSSFTLNDGGYINAEFTTKGTLPQDANLINVTNGATINRGYVRLIPDLAGTYKAGDTYTIVRAGTGLTINNGGIIDVIPSVGYQMKAIVQYDMLLHEVQLHLLAPILGYSELIDPDTNEGRVGYDLQHTPASPLSDLETIFTNLNPLSNADLIDALSQMHVFRNHSLAIANHNLYRQAADLISMHSKPLPLCPRQPKFQTLQDVVHVPTSTHKSLLLSSEKRDISPNFINFDSPVLTASGQALPLWVAGFANLQRQRMQKEYLGYNSDAGAVLTGIHLPLQDNWGLGVTFGYGQTALEWAKDQGKVRTDHYIMGLSGYWTKQQYFLEGIVLGGFDRMNSKRYLRFSNIRRKAKGNINGIEGGMQLTTGMEIKTDGLDIQPFISVSTFKSHYKRYTERGASSMNLTVKGQNSTYVFTRIGTVFSQKIVWEKGTWSPLFQVQYDFSTSMGRNKQWSKFADSATAFFTRGDTLNRHTFVVGGGVQVEMPAGLTVKMLYNFKVNSKAINHEAALKLNYCY
ncbi:autotransporter domain-containing protein [Candidatus Odyssella thessalonicensis]|uniref:autotransporter domain-containing protein n=2 Tax=Candidatus Odyssella thessalonicensis TaxID=84647 RepID=UPI0002E87790|nr:autotransporter domain-containing protein [Candidatus Odyssella thessalonicensis]